VKRWLIVVAVAWGLVIAGLGYYSLRNDRPTAREQTTITSALPTLDAALATVAATLDPNVSITALGGLVQVGKNCTVTVVREGVRFQRMLQVYTKPGDEAATLERIRAGLPATYKPSLSRNLLSADAGSFIVVRGGITGPGQVQISADTGCRPQNAPVFEAQPLSSAVDRAPVQSVLDALKLSAASWQAHRAACPRGGTLWTVEAQTAAGSAAGSVPDAAKPSGALLAKTDVVAYRSGSAGVVVRAADHTLTIAATTGC
jgi:hypothetical protein